MNIIAKAIFVAVLLIEAMRSAALAQAPGSDPKSCANAAGASPDATLSEKLSQSGGVVCPPNVDPAMRKPTPPTGDMPVVPPPGSPGGNPSVQPK